MLSLLIIYSYIFISSCSIGYLILYNISKILKTSEESNPILISLVGLVVISTSLNFAHFFVPIGVEVHILVFALSFFACFTHHKRLLNCIGLYFKDYHLLEWIAFGLYIFYIVLQSVQVVNYPTDEAYYYLPSIQWLIQYPVVIGLGNFALPYSYNSSWFLLDAFYGFFWVGFHFFNDMNGYLAVLTFIFCLEGIQDFRLQGDRTKAYSYFKIGLLLIALLYFKNFILTINTDFAVIIISFFSLVFILEWLENTSKIRAVVLVSICIFAFTIKISGILLLLVPLFFIWVYRKSTAICLSILVIGIFILTPYLLHNVITTGYLLSPLRFLDIFDVDWKVKATVAIGQDHIWKPFSEGIAFNGFNNTYIPTLDWYYLHFFKYTTIFTQLFHGLVLLSPLSLSIWYYYFWRNDKQGTNFLSIQKQKLSFVFLIVLAYLGLVMWLFLLPSWYWAGLKISAGYLFFLLLVHFVLFWLCLSKYFPQMVWMGSKSASFVCVLLVGLHFIWILDVFASLEKYALFPDAFHVPPTQKVQVKEVTFEVLDPTQRHECWGAKQPCLQENQNLFEMRSKTIEGGFRYQHKEFFEKSPLNK